MSVVKTFLDNQEIGTEQKPKLVFPPSPTILPLKNKEKLPFSQIYD